MQTEWKRSWQVLTLGLAMTATLMAGEPATSDETSPQTVALADLPAPARAAVEKFVAGGQINKLQKETEDGQTVYDVEAAVKNNHVEITVTADGTVLSTEERVAYDSLPQAVRDAAAKYFGDATGLQASKEIEAGKTTYEVENDKVTVEFDETGKILEEEKE